MNFEETKAEAERKYQLFVDEWVRAPVHSVVEDVLLLAKHLKAGNIQGVELQIVGPKVSIVPAPLKVISPTFQPSRNPLVKLFFAKEYARIATAEAELKALNHAFQAHLEHRYSAEQLQDLMRAKLGFKRVGAMV